MPVTRLAYMHFQRLPAEIIKSGAQFAIIGLRVDASINRFALRGITLIKFAHAEIQ